MSRPTKWDDRRDAMLRDYWSDRHLKVAEIAERINRRTGSDFSAGAITSRRAFLGLPPRPNYVSGAVYPTGDELKSRRWTLAQTDTLIRHWRIGTSVAMIGQLLGKTPEQVVTKRILQGLPPRRTPGGRKNKALVIYPPDTLRLKLNDVARTVGKSRNDYICALLARDLGIPLVA